MVDRRSIRTVFALVEIFGASVRSSAKSSLGQERNQLLFESVMTGSL